MTIHFLSEADQGPLLLNYNEGKRRSQQIPSTARNANSGWPLLQVSAFSLKEEGIYEPVFGGGPCHDFPIGAFNFACLLAKIPGRINAFVGNNPINISDLNICNAHNFLSRFTVRHLGIEIDLKSGMWNTKELTVKYQGKVERNLCRALKGSFYHALKPDSRLMPIDMERAWVYGGTTYTEQEINDQINENAVFQEGQIFVDLGELLEHGEVSQEIQDILKAAFKVDEFLTAQHEMQEEERLASREEIISETNGLTNLFQKIQKMEDFAHHLIKQDQAKGEAIQSLAIDLKEKLNAFNQILNNKQSDQPSVGQLKAELIILLHSKDDIMREHRALWKPIVTNIALCIATLGIGLLYIGVKTSYNLMDSYRHNRKLAPSDCLFFAKTNREKMIQDFESDLEISIR